MSRRRKIAILLHEKDRSPRREGYFIWGLCRVWREQGHEIQVLRGIRSKVEADLLIPHVDSTFLPQQYNVFLRSHPRALNRAVTDISKRFISRQLVRQDDNYNGPVIVKTNLNCGGAPDINVSDRKVFYSETKRRWPAWMSWSRKESTSDWSRVNCVRCEDYPIFPSRKDVPEGVFMNPWLVVERFLPEVENGIYHLRIYKFLGDRAYCARLGSPHPIVKLRNIVSREELPVPEEVVEARRAWGMDYGKIDFVMHEGRAVILDANTTPGRINPEERMRAKSLELAPGIESFFSDAPGVHTRRSDSIPQSHSVA